MKTTNTSGDLSLAGRITSAQASDSDVEIINSIDAIRDAQIDAENEALGVSLSLRKPVEVAVLRAELPADQLMAMNKMAPVYGCEERRAELKQQLQKREESLASWLASGPSADDVRAKAQQVATETAEYIATLQSFIAGNSSLSNSIVKAVHGN
jgi:hypothetical protein